MKKLMTMFLAVALCMGLAVPAFAADGYGPYSITDRWGYEISFSAAKVETGNITVDWFGEIEVKENVTIITVQPGSTITYSGEELMMGGYDRGEGDVYAVYDAYLWFLPSSATVPEVFGYSEAPERADMLDITLSFDSKTGDSEEAYIILGDGATAPSQPSTPSEPEQPSTPSEPEQPSQPTTPAEPEQPAGTVTYTVKKGDTLGYITTNYYGNNAQRNALYKANADAFKATNGKLVEGMTLVIPETLGGVKRIAAPVLAEGETLYTVKAGDTLSGIAKSVYGDMWQYKAIFERNSDRLKNANTIYEGQVIVLPAK